MDSIEQAYMSMFSNTQNKNEQNDINLIEIIINQLNKHLQFLSPLLTVEQLKLFKFIIDQNIPIELICLDKIHFKFLLKFGQTQIIFYCIPDELLIQLAAKRKPILQFYGGEIVNPDKSKIYLIFKSLPLKTKFIKKRIKFFKQQEKLEKQSNQKSQQKDDLNNIFLQYMGYFRHQ